MTAHAVVDENVSLQVAEVLQRLGYEVRAVARLPARGMSDDAVFALAIEGPSLLVTRDAHFTNPLRFPAARTEGILYLIHGNLRGDEEAGLVERFLKTHPPQTFRGHLVQLSPHHVRIR